MLTHSRYLAIVTCKSGNQHSLDTLARHCLKCFIWIILLDSSKIPTGKMLYLLPLYNEETETSKDQETCSKPHSW